MRPAGPAEGGFFQARCRADQPDRSRQEAVEAPRVRTEGNALKVELAVPDDVRTELRSMGHEVQAVPALAGGMNAIQLHDDGRLTGAACWRADRTTIGVIVQIAPGWRPPLDNTLLSSSHQIGRTTRRPLFLEQRARRWSRLLRPNPKKDQRANAPDSDCVDRSIAASGDSVGRLAGCSPAESHALSFVSIHCHKPRISLADLLVGAYSLTASPALSAS